MKHLENVSYVMKQGESQSNQELKSESSAISFEPLMSMCSVQEGCEPQCLVVDDQALPLFCIMGTLDALHMTSIGKLSGSEAVQVVKVRVEQQLSTNGRTLPLELIVIDYQMPDMDGVTTCNLIKQHFNEVKQPRDSDDPESAELRKRIFVPEIICCSAYDES